MSLSTNLARGRDHDERAHGHVVGARESEEDAWWCVEGARPTHALRNVHAARLEWAMAVCALLAWVRYGEGER